eukprot:CAMPEP_0178999584 /NCGR_PEP_ID=MMETSP0795-20121207/10148_1 /TAXON_ID=88552 /ORGANISM="Amoebophrya sp., Strain Ameob2" /LENGTH=234 /DNA_ID=CAMNT_0020692387 /DNA_START=20 /DNA_END=724 /DNA_ORIENTATION=-
MVAFRSVLLFGVGATATVRARAALAVSAPTDPPVSKQFLEKLHRIDPHVFESLDAALSRFEQSKSATNAVSLHLEDDAALSGGKTKMDTQTVKHVNALLKHVTPKGAESLKHLMNEVESEAILLQLPNVESEEHLNHLMGRLSKVDPKTAGALLKAVMVGGATKNRGSTKVSLLQAGTGTGTSGLPKDALEEEERLLKIRPLLAKLAQIDNKKFGRLSQVAKIAQSAADSQMMK